MVEIHPPPPRVAVKAVRFEIPAESYIVRVFDPTRYDTQALTFRYFGPLARYDHHHLDESASKTSVDKERGIYYAAFTLSSCLVEVFGDYRLIEVKEYAVASVKIVRDLQLLDLRGSAAMLNGSVAGLSSIPNRRLTQQWSRYFYEQSEIYGNIDGLIYSNAHNGEDALALYERARNGLSCGEEEVMRLDNRLLRGNIRAIAANNGLIVAEY